MLIRTQNNVPEIYVNDSRDFQVLCRAYDVLFNMIKFDVDSMTNVLSTSNIRSNVIPLLQQKLGFFTNKTIDDESLRKILGAFPILLKSKGSLKAIKQAIYVWLKIAHLETVVDISITTAEGTTIGQTEIPPYTVAIGIRSTTRDLTTLREILKYIIPAGFGTYLYFFYGLDVTDQNPPSILSESAKLAFVSDDINSVVRGTTSKSEMYTVEGDMSGRVFTTPISVSAYGSEVNPTNVWGYNGTQPVVISGDNV